MSRIHCRSKAAQLSVSQSSAGWVQQCQSGCVRWVCDTSRLGEHFLGVSRLILHFGLSSSKMWVNLHTNYWTGWRMRSSSLWMSREFCVLSGSDLRTVLINERTLHENFEQMSGFFCCGWGLLGLKCCVCISFGECRTWFSADMACRVNELWRELSSTGKQKSPGSLKLPFRSWHLNFFFTLASVNVIMCFGTWKFIRSFLFI